MIPYCVFNDVKNGVKPVLLLDNEARQLLQGFQASQKSMLGAPDKTLKRAQLTDNK